MIIKNNYPIILREMTVEGVSVNVPTDEIGRIADVHEIREFYNDLQILLNLSDQESIDNYNKEVEKELRESIEYHSRPKKKPTYKEGYVYFLKSLEDNIYKIGYSTNLNKRLDKITPKLPFEVKLAYKIKHNKVYRLEQYLHKKFADKRLNGEWFKLDANDIEYIKNNDFSEVVWWVIIKNIIILN